MKFFNATNNFTAGEWSPKMHARTDVQQYTNAADTIKNALVQVQGGAFRRPGTFHVPITDSIAYAQQYLDGSAEVKMIPFSYKGIRRIFYVLSNEPISNWFFTDESGTVSYPANLGPSGFKNQYFSSTNLRNIQYTQIGNTLFLSTGITPPIAIVFADNGSATMYPWSVSTNLAGYVSYPEYLKINKWEAVPYSGFLNINNKGTVILNSVGGGTTYPAGTTVWISFANIGNVFNAGSFTYPQYIRLSTSAGTMVVELTSATNTTRGDGTVVYNPNNIANGSSSTIFGNAASSTYWQYAEWGPLFSYGVSGPQWPRRVAGFEQRLVFSNTTNNPVTTWASQIGNLGKFMEIPYVQDSSFATYASDNSRAFSFTLAAGNSNEIRALSATKSLFLHSDDGEYVAYTANGSALGPLNISISNSTSFGSEAVQPYRINNFLTYVQSGGRKVRDIVFSFEQDQYKSNDLTFVSDHLTVSDNDIDKIVEICKVEDPSSILFARTENNRLLSLTLDRDYGINAWAEHEIGLGTHQYADNEVIAICILPDHQIGDGIYRDYLYAIVKVNNSSNDKELVRLAAIYEYEDADTTNPPIYLDRAKFSTSGGLGTTLITGLSHLNGNDADVVADGLYIGRFPISGGQADIGRTYTWAYAGIPYETVITPLPIETGTQLGSSLGITKRIDEVTIFFWNSYGFEYGKPDEALIELDFRDPTVPTGDGVKLFTGIKRVQFPAGYDRRARVTIKQRRPWPCNVLAVVSRGTTYD